MSEKIQAQNVLEFSSEFLEQVKREAEVRDVEWAIDQLRNRLQEYYNALEPLRLVLVNKKGIWLPSRSGEEDGDAVYTDAIIDVFCKNYCRWKCNGKTSPCWQTLFYMQVFSHCLLLDFVQK